VWCDRAGRAEFRKLKGRRGNSRTIRADGGGNWYVPPSNAWARPEKVKTKEKIKARAPLPESD